jgi:hypothetical protein
MKKQAMTTGIALLGCLAIPITALAGVAPNTLPAPVPQSAAARPASAPVSPLTEAIGVVAAVKGTVEIVRGTGAPARQAAQSGALVFQGDEIITGPESRFQLLLRDETTFTLGENARITVDEFVYDPATSEGTVAANISKGAFRFITGRVARKNPKKMTIRLPVGTIGIRGTMGAGRTSDRPGEPTSVLLLGPGRDNTTGDEPGGITVGNDAGREDIDDPGYGTDIPDENSAPSEPRQFSGEDVNEITGELGSAPGETPAGESPEEDGGENGESPTEEGGQDTFQSVDVTEETGETESVQQVLQTATNNSAQDRTNAATAAGIADGIATFDQLRTLESGTAFYSFDGILRDTSTNNFNAQLATYTLRLDINFATKKAGGLTTSKIIGTPTSYSINGNQDFSFVLEEQDFAGNTGNAAFTYSNLADSSCSNCTASATITLNNSGGTIAQNADHTFTLKDSSTGTTGSGSGNAAASA